VRVLYSRRDLFLMEIPAEAPWAHLPLAVIERAYKAASGGVGTLSEAATTADGLLTQELALHTAA